MTKASTLAWMPLSPELKLTPDKGFFLPYPRQRRDGIWQAFTHPRRFDRKMPSLFDSELQ